MPRNRYGDEYDFVKVNENTYEIVGELKYWRYGGKEGQETMDFSDLGMVDPSGGPYIEVGMPLGGKEIKRIYVEGQDLDEPNRILFEVE